MLVLTILVKFKTTKFLVFFMIKTRKLNTKIIFIFLVTLILAISLTWYLASLGSSRVVELEKEIKDIEEFNKFYSKGLTEFNYAIFNQHTATYNYDLWDFYYNQGYFFDSIGYCEGARELWVEANSDYQKAVSYFEEADKTAKEKYKELIDYYIKASNSGIDINWAMYEACEYFESACNYYSQGIYETGDSELETGNEKIALHDGLIKDYNKYISKIEVLEESI